MKKALKRILVFIMCVPALLFCACQNSPSSLPQINVSGYYESVGKTTLLNETKNGSISLGDLTATKPNLLTLGSYVQIELTGKRNWLYKMYIDYVTFYVYTNEARYSEMIVNLTISNLADEDDRTHPSKFSAPARFIPLANGATLCTIKVGKVVANATDASSDSMTIDILNSVNNTVADSNGNPTSFRWTVYGLTIYGESRAYSK